ncbi:ubiquinol-cytochrome c reductase subunit 9 [Cryptococcus neoformans]|uniref:Complex III subunit 9 n=2 Tax=Cryptococcus neoformans TaxID=5207 RepID=A0A854QGC8_CRYNE|nr:ubiquinol-cytochrome c reductase subunit 9 [Cryptococcus neoformans var. grubii H99]AUB29293.1 ubiquinol-cytochrome c reductase subunit 9 [Cryptococcus neoformans var. grubii]OWT35457.1 ubiquinol-cytochrome c reductase subunit 9 [Cryptococcus neoformans var. grubii Bt1]OWZ26006.1 ubiquinol-cytochrome c reductase subunit 9 [Cryptococcus neoformans var. grubii AD2-60a]OWZ26136.1 ubiquinol-cytochrome c reductase subunit 9 [Cryptococcus neoformans var. grubii AD1-83a]OWZ38035.1 ubiquinol-cytoch|eukprot:XP_012053892.1 ubiquinol-cytochrome c reductase subunit 9 [Cryptococcus neoformans var. grubii H99]
MPGFQDVIYNTFFRRNSVFVATTFITAFTFSMGFDLATTAFWDSHNRGKQWKDIRHKYLEAAGDDE